MTISVSALHLYPVKSLRGISVSSALLTDRGLAYDRRFLIVDDQNEFMTQRETPAMATIATGIDGDMLVLTSAFGDSARVPLTPVPHDTFTVVVWNSRVQAHTVSAEADAFLSEHMGESVRLVYMPDSSERACNPEFAKQGEIVSFADGYPVLIANEASLADLNTRIANNGGSSVPMNRFRPNIVVSGASAWQEDEWQDIVVGEAALRHAKPCVRCQVTTTDQLSGELRGPEPLATLSTFRDFGKGPQFGANLVPVQCGKISLGDTLQARTD